MIGDQLDRRLLQRQFLSFAAVGVVGTAAHYVTMLALIYYAHVSPLIGTGAGFMAGLLASYALNRRWTFDKRPPFARGLLAYFLVCIIGFGINVSVVAFAMWLGVHFMIGQVFATVLALFWNFLSSRFVVFR